MTGSRFRPVWLLTVCVLLAAAAAVPAAEVTVRAVAEPEQISADGTVRLRITLDGSEVDQAEPPSLTGLDDWTVVNGPSVSSQFRYVNGVASSRRSFSWVLAPARTGRMVIPSLTVIVAGGNYATEPILIDVSSTATPGAGGGPDNADNSSADVFMRAVVEPQRPFVGEPVLLSYRLYSRVEVAGVPQLQEMPAYPDFLAREIEGPQSITATLERVDGREYRVYVIRQMALVPTASGSKVLPQATFSVPLRSSGRQRRSFLFNMSAVEPVYRRTLPLTVEVRPLPLRGRPDDFSGAVGVFNMDARLDRLAAGTGEAVGLTIDVEGRGNLKSAQPPLLTPHEDFTPYEPQEQAVAPSSSRRFASARRWEFILVPHVPGNHLLPEVVFSYFDPKAEAYRTLTVDDLELAVEGQALAQGGEGGSAPARKELKRLGADIDFIKPLPGVPGNAGRAAYHSAWFWLLLLAPPLANLTVLGVRWQSRRSLLRLPVSRRRRARRLARRRLEKAQSLAEGDASQEFYRLLAQALTEFVADKFNAPATGLTYDRIAALLARENVDESCARDYLKVLEECDCARFSPTGDDAATRRDLARRAGEALETLGGRL